MTTDDLIKYIDNPDSLDGSTINEITLLADKYPYFQTAQLLRVKNIHNLAPAGIKPVLNFTAAYVTDRKILYYLLHPFKQKPDTKQDTPTTQETNNSNDLQTNRSYNKDIKDSMAENISDTLNNQVNSDFDLSEKELEFSTSINIKKEYGKDVELTEYVVRITEEGPELMELLDDENTTTSDNLTTKSDTKTDEDLLLMINKGVALNTSDLSNNKLSNSQSKNNQLIDNFISSNPRITPLQTDGPNEDISENSIIENDRYLTDTLAKIYMKQGNYGKAIFAYEKLSLKFPEKSTYFAGQIAEIKKLIDKSK